MSEDSGKKDSELAATAGSKSGGKCPICGKPAEQHYRPFCSQRCQQVDLGRWLGETYRIAADQDPASSPSEPEED